MQEEGFIAKLLYPEGTKDVALGKAVAILVENEEDIAAFANYVESDAPASTPAQPAPQEQASTPEPTPV